MKTLTDLLLHLKITPRATEMQNALITVSAVIGICITALGIVFGVIYPPLAFTAAVIFIGCILAAIISELKD